MKYSNNQKPLKSAISLNTLSNVQTDNKSTIQKKVFARKPGFANVLYAPDREKQRID